MTRVLVLAAILSVTASFVLSAPDKGGPGIESEPGTTQEFGPLSDPWG